MAKMPHDTIDREELAEMLLRESKHHVNIRGKIITVVNHLPFSFSVPMTEEQRRERAREKRVLLKQHQMACPAHSDFPRLGAQHEKNGHDHDDHEQRAPISNLARRRSTLPNLGHTSEWEIKARSGHSALYAGVQVWAEHYETLMIGGAGVITAESNNQDIKSEDLPVERRNALTNLLRQRYNMVPVFVNHDQMIGHYDGYCKKVLWPLFHYVMWNGQLDESQYWNDYVTVNQQYAQAVAAHYEPGDMVWVQDYHLALVPQMLRELRPDALVGLFIHTPFPSSEIFRCLPHRREILNGMLGANMVGFQTYNYARHFSSNCTRVLGYESTPDGIETRTGIVSLGIFPIGIDVEKTRANCRRPGVAPKVKAIRERYVGKRIIVGRDKLDPAKGVLQKLEAFEKFLTDYPEWRDKVVLIQVTSPGVVASPKMEAKIAEVVARINTAFGSIAFTPISYYHQHIDRDEFYALLTAADVGLVTPVCDGMNTTSFEFVVAQEERHSPLILSEFAGTARSMSAAVIVNPWDFSWVANAINECLNMTVEDRNEKALLLQQYVNTHTAAFWATSLVNNLMAIKSKGTRSKNIKLEAKRLAIEYKTAAKRLFFFDYDGTLAPICERPEDATPTPEVLEMLKGLCSNPLNTVWVVSGRDQKTLEAWLGGIPHLGMSAEHGCFSRVPDGKWVSNIESIDMAWKDDVREIFRYYCERTPGSHIEEKKGSITWHYRQADPKYGAFQANECQNHLEQSIVGKLPVETLVGKMNLEVRPTLINKGEVIKKCLGQSGATDFVFCAGDDRTDEDMFRVLANVCVDKLVFTVSVGPADKQTIANWYVNSSHELIKTLEALKGI
ncbi:glycosyltransferase family 20-domain-containing protein [Gongronella butleri]|nr:glycosyltransferase family 20-domain-containing protein [Gongronella butleri]